MLLASLPGPIIVAASALILFGVLVIARISLMLLREAKRLREHGGVAFARLRAAARELEVESKRAAERASSLGGRPEPGSDRGSPAAPPAVGVGSWKGEGG